MKNFKKIVIVLVVIALVLIAKFLFISEFHAGDCVENYDGKIIWHINSFSLGEYRTMGWFDGAWGNEVEMEKGLIESSTDSSGAPYYHQITCPEFNPSR